MQGENKQGPQNDVIIRMVIEFNPLNDGCQVTGPDRPSLCYSMLEMARDVIFKSANAAKRPALTVVPPGFDPGKGPLAHG